jgi:hypothetical protein
MKQFVAATTHRAPWKGAWAIFSEQGYHGLSYQCPP